MKLFSRLSLALALFCCVAVSTPAPAQSNGDFAAQTFTGDATGSPLLIPQLTYATVELTGTITTITFQILVSNDGGKTYFPAPFAAIATPGTLVTQTTATSQGLYVINLAGLTDLEIVTSGTFTASNAAFKVTAAYNH